MKKTFLFLLTTIFLSACERDYIKNNTLPPLTHTGADTAGCLVNGEVFVPKGFFPWAISNLSCTYEDGEYFTISIIRKKDNSMRGVDIYCYGVSFHDNIGLAYTLENYDQNQNSNYARYSGKLISSSHPFFYTTTDIFIGELGGFKL